MRSHYCGDLRASHDGQTVTLCGWVHRRRDHGGVIFLDLRDRTGLVQVVFDPDTEQAFALADKVRGEYVLKVEGRVRMRDEAVRNSRMDTGDIEVLLTGNPTDKTLRETVLPPNAFNRLPAPIGLTSLAALAFGCPRQRP